jgi:hypothetical protein
MQISLPFFCEKNPSTRTIHGEDMQTSVYTNSHTWYYASRNSDVRSKRESPWSTCLRKVRNSNAGTNSPPQLLIYAIPSAIIYCGKSSPYESHFTIKVSLPLKTKVSKEINTFNITRFTLKMKQLL